MVIVPRKTIAKQYLLSSIRIKNSTPLSPVRNQHFMPTSRQQNFNKKQEANESKLQENPNAKKSTSRLINRKNHEELKPLHIELLNLENRRHS